MSAKKIRGNWSESQSIDSTAKVCCKSCSWNVIWHQFGGTRTADLTCELCGGEVVAFPAKPSEIFKFRPKEEKNYGHKHYTANGVCKSLSLF